jgi:hypothetical protein
VRVHSDLGARYVTQVHAADRTRVLLIRLAALLSFLQKLLLLLLSLTTTTSTSVSPHVTT